MADGYGNNNWYDYDDPDKAAEEVRKFIDDTRIWRINFLTAYHNLVELYERELWDSVYNSYGFGLSADSGQVGDEGIDGYRNARQSSDNFFKGACDALLSRLFPELPRLQVATLGGDYRDHLVAQRKTWALRSTLGETAPQSVIFDVLLDQLKTGFGAAIPEVVQGSYRLQRVILDDLYYHPLEVRDRRKPRNPPPSLHYMQRISRGQAYAMVKALDIEESEKNRMCDEIKALAQPIEPGAGSSSYETPYDRHLSYAETEVRADLVGVLRSWHLPSSLDAGDGRECVQITGLAGFEPSNEGVAIYYDKWECETHPVVWSSSYWVHQGLVGIGMGQIVEPYQQQHDQGWARANRLISQWGNPNVAIPAEMDNENDKGDIAGEDTVNFVKIPGMPMSNRYYEIITHNAQSSELLNWLERVPDTAMARIGLNTGALQGGTKLGANASGAALNAEDNRMDIRFADVLRRADEMYIWLAEETLNVLDRTSESDPSFYRRFADQWGGEFEIPWSELRMSHGSYAVRIELTGALGRTAAARIRSAQELQAAAPEYGAAAIETTYISHDLPALAEEVNSDRMYVEWQLYYLGLYSDTKEDRAEKLAPYWPNELTDLDIAEQLSRKTLQRAWRLNADESVIAVLTEYRARVQKERAKRASQQPPAPQPMPGLAPEGMPAEVPPPDIGMPPMVA